MSTYDRNSTGWDFVMGQTNDTRPEDERQRCGEYFDPKTGEKNWGDHRVTLPGTTCEETRCEVAHHPTVMPGWAEPQEGFYERPGVKSIAAATWGWSGAGMTAPLGDSLAWVIAHVALDALRDAGYEIVKREE